MERRPRRTLLTPRKTCCCCCCCSVRPPLIRPAPKPKKLTITTDQKRQKSCSQSTHTNHPRSAEDCLCLPRGTHQLPRRPGVLDRRQRGRPRAAVVTRHLNHVRVGLGHARRHRPDPNLGHLTQPTPETTKQTKGETNDRMGFIFRLGERSSRRCFQGVGCRNCRLRTAGETHSS